VKADQTYKQCKQGQSFRALEVVNLGFTPGPSSRSILIATLAGPLSILLEFAVSIAQLKGVKEFDVLSWV